MHLMMERDMTEGIFKSGDIFAGRADIYRLAEELRIPERKIIDFSSPVNPLGVSKKIKAEIRRHLKYLNNYPDPETKRLSQKLAQYHGISPAGVICGNGASELLHLIIKTLRPRTVLIPSPSSPGYESAVLSVRDYGGWSEEPQVAYLMLKGPEGFEIKPGEFIGAMREQSASPDFARHSMLSGALAFLCNPNNPTGRLLNKGDIRKIAESAKELGWHLVVDEALIDFCPGNSVIEDVADNPYLIVLRTQSYFHALAGLRIGYGVFPPDLSERLRAVREPLTVNSLAQRAAALAVKDRVYERETLKLVSQEKRFLERSFKKLGLDYFPSDANFYLLKTGNANEIGVELKRNGILLRDFSNVRGLGSGYLGIAVKSHRENAILVRELTDILLK